MWASSGVVPSSGAKLVMVVVMTSSSRAMAVQSRTNRTRQSIGMATSRGTKRFRSMGVREPPITIQKRIRPSAIRIIARSLTLPEDRMTMFSRVTSRPL